MADAYMGQFLFIDLTLQTYKAIPLPEWLKNNYIGGKGFGAKLLYDLVPAKCDPLGPENALMFLTGPLTGTIAPAMRACIVTKSPLTGTFLDSYFGGYLGPEIKYAGYDGFIITGKAATPVYLSITDTAVSFHAAEEIWGTNALEANRSIKNQLNDQHFKIASIGQAGENQVLFSLVSCEFNRQAGRGGAGAVMGSKNLKAVAIKGNRLIKVHNPGPFSSACNIATEEIKASPDCASLTDAGTSSAIPWSNNVGLLPFRNFHDQVDPKANMIGDSGQKKHLFLGKAACSGCPIRCSQMGAVRTGKHAHFVTDIVEYESAALMGSNLDIHNIRAIAHLVKLCDSYGMDSMSAGGVIGFAFEAVEKGLIKAPSDVKLSFGSVAGAEYLIKAIAFKSDNLGKLLSKGVKRASEEIGQDSKDFAVHTKGLESPAWGARGIPGMGLAYMTADRGGCHQRGFMISYEVGGEPYKGKPVETYGLEQKAEILIGRQNYLAGVDALIKCDFGSFGVSPASYAGMLSAATGLQITDTFINELGERIWNQTRLFNLREGIDHTQDRLPNRFVNEPLPSGPHKGHRISEADMDFLRNDYYKIRGWDSKGQPSADTLKRLGLHDRQAISLKI